MQGDRANVLARFNGGDWQTVATDVWGSFSGYLSGQPQGQGAVEVKLDRGNTDVTSVATVGIGDVFQIYGQSNSMGMGTNNQLYSHLTLKAGLLANDLLWHELADPYANNTDNVDAVLDTGGLAGGSVWPLLATLFMADQGVPVAFIPAVHMDNIATLLPGANHLDRTTAYGAMHYRAQMVGGVKTVLYWQGETDAIDGIAQAAFNADLDTIINAIQADLGVKTMVCKFQDCTAIAQANQDAILAGIAEAWGDNPNALQGPDLSDIQSDDGYHLQTDAKLLTAAQRWWAALDAAFYA